MFIKKIHKHLDIAGIGVSVLCAVHCSLLPVLATVLPMLGLQFFNSEATETLFILLSVIIGITSLSASCRQHKNLLPLGFILSGFTVIAIGKLCFKGEFEWLFMTIGGLTIATAHYINRRKVKGYTAETLLACKVQSKAP
jgi:hypothetical protein